MDHQIDSKIYESSQLEATRSKNTANNSTSPTLILSSQLNIHHDNSDGEKSSIHSISSSRSSNSGSNSSSKSQKLKSTDINNDSTSYFPDKTTNSLLNNKNNNDNIKNNNHHHNNIEDLSNHDLNQPSLIIFDEEELDESESLLTSINNNNKTPTTTNNKNNNNTIDFHTLIKNKINQLKKNKFNNSNNNNNTTTTTIANNILTAGTAREYYDLQTPPSPLTYPNLLQKQPQITLESHSPNTNHLTAPQHIPIDHQQQDISEGEDSEDHHIFEDYKTSLNKNYETMTVLNNTNYDNQLTYNSNTIDDDDSKDNNNSNNITKPLTNNTSQLHIFDATSPSQSSSHYIPYHRLHPSHSSDTYLLMQDKIPQKEDTFFQSLKKVLIAGTGFLCDAYDLFVINNVIVILQLLYPAHKGSSSIVSTAALWGAVAGQLLFGFFADRVGRRVGFIVTLSFITLGALGSTLSFNITDGFNIFVMLAIWRTILGFGVGGEYPLSATISSESASTHQKRGSQVASVFSMQGVGIILSPIIILILLRICGPDHLDIVWRVALAFGGIPGLIMIYFRIRMKETKAFENRKNTISKREIARYICKNHWKTLLGTAGNWFIFDIVFYANGLFSSTIVLVLNFDAPKTDYDKLINTVLTALYLALLGLPGYFVGIALIDRLGRRNLQLLGFFLLGVTYIIMGATLDYIVKIKALFIILYGLTFFFSNAGPNTTTYVLPSESFPTRVRATCHGISAACGKLGAVLGGYAIQPFFKSNGLGHTLLVCGGISFAGLILTFFVTKETMGQPPIEDDIELSVPVPTPGEPIPIDDNDTLTDSHVESHRSEDV